MNEGTLRSLEFDRIVEVVQSFALTPLGAAELGKLQPLTEPLKVREALNQTSECTKYLLSLIHI